MIIHYEIIDLDIKTHFQDIIYMEMQRLFSDLRFYNEWVDTPLKQAIADIDKNVIDINFATVKKFAHRYFATGRFVTKEEMEIWKEIQMIFTTCCVLVVSKRPETKALFYESTDRLFEDYPSFASCKPIEVGLLLKFRNMLVAALQVVSPRHNKQLLLYVGGRLEGTPRRYVTGSGMSEAVKRRVMIYEREGKVEPEPRPDRINPVVRSIQIRRAEEIRRAAQASRAATDGLGLTRPPISGASIADLSAVKLEFPIILPPGVSRSTSGATIGSTTKTEPFSMVGKRDFSTLDLSNESLDLSNEMQSSIKAEIARDDTKRKSATFETDQMLNENVMMEASLSDMFNLNPIEFATASPRAVPVASSQTLLTGRELKSTFGMDLLCAAMAIREKHS